MKTILVIDDEQAMLDTLSAILRSAGYDVETANSGEAGLRLAYERIPDLILCDIHLPDLDGTTVLQALREDPATADRQIVLMTGYDKEAEQLREVMNLGADDFLQKPFLPKDLIDCVEARLRRNDLNRHIASRTYEQFRHTLHSTLPHEFFAPIANILGIADMLNDKEDLTREDLRGLITEIERHARRLHRSFDNYIKLIELETCSTKKPCAPTPAGKAWNTITSTAQSTAHQRGRGNDLRIDGLPSQLPLSQNELATLVEELIDNACAYSHKGTPIHLNVSCDTDFIRIEVRDQGRGMSEAQIRELQETALPPKSAQAATSLSPHDQKIHGIGLLIVQKIAEARGGGLQIHSQPTQGTRCTLFWPSPAAT